MYLITDREPDPFRQRHDLARSFGGFLFTFMSNLKLVSLTHETRGVSALHQVKVKKKKLGQIYTYIFFFLQIRELLFYSSFYWAYND